MFIIEVVPLIAISRNLKRIYSFFHAENLPAGSLVQVFVSGKKTKAVVINSQSIKYLKIRLKKEADFELKPIIKVLDKNPDPNKDPLDVGHWFPPVKKLPEIKKEKRGEDTKNILDGYMERLAERKAVTKAKNYMQETTEEYLKYIDWENDSFEEDMRLFWISASNYYKRHTHHDFVKILEWVKDKDSLNPKQVAKLFNKE